MLGQIRICILEGAELQVYPRVKCLFPMERKMLENNCFCFDKESWNYEEKQQEILEELFEGNKIVK